MAISKWQVAVGSGEAFASFRGSRAGARSRENQCFSRSLFLSLLLGRPNLCPTGLSIHFSYPRRQPQAILLTLLDVISFGTRCVVFRLVWCSVGRFRNLLESLLFSLKSSESHWKLSKVTEKSSKVTEPHRKSSKVIGWHSKCLGASDRVTARHMPPRVGRVGRVHCLRGKVGSP